MKIPEKFRGLVLLRTYNRSATPKGMDFPFRDRVEILESNDWEAHVLFSVFTWSETPEGHRVWWEASFDNFQPLEEYYKGIEIPEFKIVTEDTEIVNW